MSLKKEKKNKKKSKKSNIFELFRNAQRTLKIFWQISPKSFVISIIAILFISTLPFAGSYLNGRLINLIVEYLGGNNAVLNEIYWYFGYCVATTLLLEIFYRITDFLDRFAYFDWHEKLSSIVTEKLASLDMEKYEDAKFNTLLTKVRDGYDHKPANFAFAVLWILNDLIQILAALVILFSLNIFLLPLIFLSLLPEFLVTIKGSKLKWGIWDAKGEVNKLYWTTRDSLTNEKQIKEVRIFGAKSYLLDFAGALKKNFLDEQRNVLKKEGFFAFLSKFLELSVGVAVELWLLVRVLTRTPGFGIGNYTFFLQTINRFSSSSRNLLRNVGRLHENNLYMTDLYKLLDLKNKIQFKENAVQIDQNHVPHIEFKNVSFVYPGTTKNVFDNFSIQIEPGEDIALVGENGAGKTTFVKLLSRFYDVQEGEILINGVNIKDVDIQSWYKNIGVLFQDFNKYGFTARKNIYLGDVSKNDTISEIESAAIQAGADKIILEQKKKYEQILSKWFEKGTELSGGQWQRIALARAFFRNANILILDEPTSAIDAKGEYEIFKKIAEVQKEKSTIIISHRFSTVKKADKIYVIDEGKITEQGRHEELMQIENGKYKEMFELQAEGYR